MATCCESPVPKQYEKQRKTIDHYCIDKYQLPRYSVYSYQTDLSDDQYDSIRKKIALKISGKYRSDSVYSCPSLNYEENKKNDTSVRPSAMYKDVVSEDDAANTKCDRFDDDNHADRSKPILLSQCSNEIRDVESNSCCCNSHLLSNSDLDFHTEIDLHNVENRFGQSNKKKYFFLKLHYNCALKNYVNRASTFARAVGNHSMDLQNKEKYQISNLYPRVVVITICDIKDASDIMIYAREKILLVHDVVVFVLLWDPVTLKSIRKTTPLLLYSQEDINMCNFSLISKKSSIVKKYWLKYMQNHEAMTFLLPIENMSKMKIYDIIDKFGTHIQADIIIQPIRKKNQTSYLSRFLGLKTADAYGVIHPGI